MKRTLLVALVLLASCARTQTAHVTMTLGPVPPAIRGNVVSIPVKVFGIRIVKPNGDTSGKTGHFHVFVDRRVVAPGAVIPHAPNIVHSADDPVIVYGLTPGRHTLRVVLGDGAHHRIYPKVHRHVVVNVLGPAVQGSAPARIFFGAALIVGLKAEGVTIVAPGAETGPGEGHFHVIVDPPSPPAPGQMLGSSMSPSPGGGGGSGAEYMTGSSSISIPGLARGEHTIFVVLANENHQAWTPAVMDKLTVTVT